MNSSSAQNAMLSAAHLDTGLSTSTASKITECELCYIDKDEEPQLLNYDRIVEI
jgi:hypothetical protein